MARHADPGPTGGAVVGRDGRRPMTVPRPSAGLRALLMAAIVAAAVGVGLWASQGSASAQAPAANAITTELRPGWNLVGWMGPDTTSEDLFDSVPVLQVVASWDEDRDRYTWARRGGRVPLALEQVARGQALFLWVGGPDPVQWTRPASAAGMLLTLPAGSSLVSWAGLDGTPLSEAVGRFGAALTGVSTWNAETQSYERYTPGEDDSAEGAAALNHGDALWVELSEERRWWQSRGLGPEFVFAGDLSEAEQAEHRVELAHVLAAFKERYDIEPPEFFVLVDPELDIAADAREGRIRVGAGAVDHPLREFAYAHEYFHILQYHLGQRDPSGDGSPAWLTEGSARYAEDVYRRERLNETAEGVRSRWWILSLSVTTPLSALEDIESFYALENAGYQLGALATDWLVRRAAASPGGELDFTPLASDGLELREDHAAHLKYYELRQSSVDWRQTFRDAFGIGVEEFYEAFDEYRAAFGASRLPHLADDRDEPILVFEGEIPVATMDRIRTQFDELQDFFRDRLGSGPADYTTFVVADWPDAAALIQRVLGREEERHCGSLGHYYTVQILSCDSLSSLMTDLAWQRFTALVDRLAPAASLPPGPEGSDSRGPAWLTRGMVRYAEAAARAALEIDALADRRSSHARDARRTPEPLRDLATPAGLAQAEDVGGTSLSFLAVDWLVQRAGERAIGGYYRLLPTSDSWQEAFEGAFGITIDDFYTAFKAYRREAVTSPPHEADDVAEPILVLLGEVPPSVADDLRSELQNLQAFVDDRFGHGPADYTVYVALDRESAAEAITSDQLGENTCYVWVPGIGPLWVLTCGGIVPGVTYLPRDFARGHLSNIRSRLTAGAESVGPHWLELGWGWYVERAYPVHRWGLGAAGFAQARVEEIALARSAAYPLRGVEPFSPTSTQQHPVNMALSFLAADWLAQRAGEPALFEYYRLLPSSDSWEQAFEAAFGITIDDFYREFAEYRAGL